MENGIVFDEFPQITVSRVDIIFLIREKWKKYIYFGRQVCKVWLYYNLDVKIFSIVLGIRAFFSFRTA